MELTGDLQLNLGQLISLLENVKDKSLPVVYDSELFYPTVTMSWRGSYELLAIGYSQMQEGEPPTVSQFIAILKQTIGKTFTGYKGGDYIMTEDTLLWIANYGESYGFKYSGLETQAPIGITLRTYCVIIETATIGF